MAYGDLSYRLDPARVALLVVDVQWDFCGPSSAAGEARDNSAMDVMTGHLNGLIGAARGAGVPVVYVRSIADADNDSLAWRTRRGETYPFAASPGKAGTPGAEMYCDQPEAGEAVVTKTRYDAFVGTDLDARLRAMGRESLVVTGVLTDICVETAVRHAVSLDYLVTVASDCCQSSVAEHHEAALARIVRSFGLVVPAAEVVARWPAGEPEPGATVPAQVGSSS
jgi:nicotinamidase-related amidase